MNKNLFMFFSAWFVAITILCVMMISDLRKNVALENLHPGFSYYVKGCADSENGIETRGPLNDDRGPGVVLSGNSLVYYRAVNHLCCRKAEARVEFSGFEIDLYEVWSGQGCRCTCFSEIIAGVDRFPPGRYTLNVYETGTKADGEPMEKATILTKEFFITAK